MTDRILFQQDRLTVRETKLTLGKSSIPYPKVSRTTIEEGRPLIALGIGGLAGMILVAGASYLRGQFPEPYFPANGTAVLLLPFLAMAIIGFTYRVKSLILTVETQSIPALKSKERNTLEAAQRAISEAKRAYETKAAKRNFGHHPPRHQHPPEDSAQNQRPVMVKRYYANKHARQNGDHAVHREDCDRLPPPDHRLDLGYHYAPETAVSKARLHNLQAGACTHCSPEAHSI